MRFLLVDDQNLVLEALGSYLRSLWPEARVVQATTVADAIRAAGEEGPFDLVLLDYQMPGISGLTGLSGIRRATGNAPIVFCSGFMDSEAAKAAMAQGAAGILTKDMGGPALVSALRRIIKGERIVSSSLPTEDDHPVDEDPKDARRLLGGLSQREYEILGLLVEGLSNKAIARRLDIAESTVKLHLHHAFAKMSARNRADAVRIFLSLR